MIDLYFYDRDGNPIPGKKPTPLHIIGGGKPDPVQMAAIRAAFLQFTTAARLSLAGVSSRTYVIDERCTLLVQQNQDTFRAFATVLPPLLSRSAHFGIVVQLDRVSNPSYWDAPQTFSATPTDRGADLYPPPSVRELLPEHAGGANDPYTVPGPLGRESTAPTDTLIFKIASSGNLKNRPIARGLVSIERIRSPKRGAIASHRFDGADPQTTLNPYIVSAAYHAVQFEGDLSILGPLFLCGQQLPIPPLVGRATIFARESRIPGTDALYAHGFLVTNFSTIEGVGGVVLYADAAYTLYAYDTARPELGWQQIHRASPPEGVNVRPYGRDFFASANDLGQVNITCSGADNDEQLSGFTAALTRRDAGGYNISGNITLQVRQPQPDKALLQFNKSVTWTNTRVLFDAGLRNDWLMSLSYVVPHPLISVSLLVSNHDLYQSWQITYDSTSAGRFAYAPQYADDWFLGGLLYRVEPYAVEFTTATDRDMGSVDHRLVRTSAMPVLEVNGYTGTFYAVDVDHPFGGTPNVYGPIYSDTNPIPWTDLDFPVTVVDDTILGSFPVSAPVYPVYEPYSPSSSLNTSARVTISSPVLGDIVYESSRNRQTNFVWVDAQPGVDGYKNTASDDRDYITTVSPRGGAFQTDPRERFKHLSYDMHRNTLLLRETFERAGSWAFVAQSTGVATGTYQANLSACELGAEIVNRRLTQQLDVVRDEPWRFDYVSAFDGLQDAGAFSPPPFAGFSDDNSLDVDFNLPDEGTFLGVTPFDTDSPFQFDKFFSYLQHWLPVNKLHHETSVVGDAPTPIADDGDYQGTFSMSINVNERTNSQVLRTTAQYESGGEADIPNPVPYPLGGFYTTDPDAQPWPIYKFHWADNLHNELYLVDASRRPDTQVIDNYLYVDPRTDGYIAQAFIDGKHTSGDVRARHRLVIGNSDGCVPLVDVLNEWLEVQGVTTRYEDGEIIIRRESAPEVSLI